MDAIQELNNKIYKYVDTLNMDEYNSFMKQLSGRYHMSLSYKDFSEYIHKVLTEKFLLQIINKEQHPSNNKYLFKGNEIYMYRIYSDFKYAFEKYYNEKKYYYDNKIKSLQELFNILKNTKVKTFHSITVSGNDLIKKYCDKELLYYITFKKNMLVAIQSKLNVVKVYYGDTYKLSEVTTINDFESYRKHLLIDLTFEKYNYVKKNLNKIKSLMTTEELNQTYNYNLSIFKNTYDLFKEIIKSYHLIYEDNIDIVKNTLVVKTLK